MDFCENFKKLVISPEWKDKFIGYGNPNSKVLIIGQEAGLSEGTDDWNDFYLPNQEHWERTINDKLIYRNGFERKEGERYCFPQFFNPLFPFYKQLNAICRKSKEDGHIISGKFGTSQTWFWYQKLIDTIYPDNNGHKEYVDFFEKSFITELNDKTRTGHSVKQKELIQNIAHRFDMMKSSSDFWKHFKVVVFACGSYADAINIEKAKNMDSEKRQQIEKLFLDIFGEEVKPFYCYQLNTRNGAQQIIEELGPKIKTAISD